MGFCSCGKYARINITPHPTKTKGATNAMFIPEYVITSRIVKNIGIIEYSRAIIENTTLIPALQKQIEKEAKQRYITAALKIMGVNLGQDVIKKYIDNLSATTQKELVNLNNTLNLLNELNTATEIGEEDLKTIHTVLGMGLIGQNKLGTYRNKKLPGYLDPAEILAELTELMDWYNSLEAKETHPIIVAAVLKGRLDSIIPFENHNNIVSGIASYLCLKNNGYMPIKDFVMEDYFLNSTSDYDQLIYSLDQKEPDFTQWIEFYTDGLSMDISKTRDKVELLAKDSKIAKAVGHTKLTPRQQRIVAYLQDYGSLFNRDFKVIFPDISEDSVLRDLKVLINMNIVEKAGSTKSSRYELV